MNNYKTTITLSWKFDTNKNHGEALEYAKKQLEKIVDLKPKGEDFESFTAHVSLTKLKNKKKMEHLAEFSLEDVFPYITEAETRKIYVLGKKSYDVKMNSPRYHLFKANNICVSCGLVGDKLFLDKNDLDINAHFNLYAEENERLVMLTKDHIIARSKGGADSIENFQTMCSVCNNLKGSHDITLDNCRELRKLFNNPDKLSRKELSDLININRQRMEKENGKVKNDK